jgi:hypothetical protein
VDSALQEFTRHALEKGIGCAEIERVLAEAGWSEADIKAALGAYAPIDFPVPIPRPKAYLSAREVFTYLVMFTALYMSAYHLGSLIFDFIERAFPDPIVDGVFRGDSGNSIRWSVSTLIVAFPLFLFMFRIVNRAIAIDPTKRSSRPRKWLTYLTLFIAAVTLTGDVIYLIYNALGGELTIRFVLKVLTVGIIAGGAFAYFLTDIRKEEAE